MGRHRSIEKLSKIALELIGKQLDEIAKVDRQLSHDTAQDLCRYFTALQGDKKLRAKGEESEKKKLSKLSTAELKRMVGLAPK